MSDRAQLIAEQDAEYAASLAVDRERRLRAEADDRHRRAAAQAEQVMRATTVRGVRVKVGDRLSVLERDTFVGELSALVQSSGAFVRASVARSALVGGSVHAIVRVEMSLGDVAQTLGATERETIVLSSGADVFLTLSDVLLLR
jgi:hypothetical protein